MVGLRRPAQKVTPLVKEVLSVLEKEKGITELLAVMGLRDRKSLRSLYADMGTDKL